MVPNLVCFWPSIALARDGKVVHERTSASQRRHDIVNVPQGARCMDSVAANASFVAEDVIGLEIAARELQA